ncbi:MAG: fluoride efflux transporter FluC [Acidimicrobiales bacterium]
MTPALFVVAGAGGAVIRMAANGVRPDFTRALIGTFAVNVIGAFLLGLLHEAGSESQLIVGVAGIGALTTFSSFVSQLECIAREGRRRDAVAYAAATLAAGIASALVGIRLA